MNKIYPYFFRKKIIKSLLVMQTIGAFFIPHTVLPHPSRSNLSAAFAQQAHVHRHHSLLRNNLNVTIDTVFAPVEQGYKTFDREFYPVVTNQLADLNNGFLSSGGGNVWSQGCFSISVFPNAEARSIASSEQMSTAPSLQAVNGRVGQGIAMCSTGTQGDSNQGYLNIDFNTSPITAIGAEIYASPQDSNQAYPKILAATVLLESGDWVDVPIADLARKKGDQGWPETNGRFSDAQGYGFVGLQSNQPIRAIQFWFQSEQEAQNALYWGGNVQLYGQTPLIYAPGLPPDQINVISANEVIYSAISKLRLDQQLPAINQILAKDQILYNLATLGSGDIDSIMASSLTSLGGSSTSPVTEDSSPSSGNRSSLMWSQIRPQLYGRLYGHNTAIDTTPINMIWGAYSGSLLDQAVVKESAGMIAMGPSKTKTWVQPIMVRQNTAQSQCRTNGVWAGWEYKFAEQLSGGFFGGWTDSNTQLIYNEFNQTTLYGGVTMSVRCFKEDIGPSVTQQFFIAESQNHNVRTVPIFKYQTGQKYRGSSIFCVSQVKWVFDLNGAMKITPYGMLIYNRNRTQAFEESVQSWTSANSIDQQVAKSAALQFNPHFASAMIQEGGIIVKKPNALLGNTSCDFWISGAIGGTQSLKQTPHEVGFVNFSDRFAQSSPGPSTVYVAPMAGATVSFSSGLQLSLGGRFQKTIQAISTDPQKSWALWFVIQKSW